MASSKTNVENSNVSGSEEIIGSEPVQLNKMVLLVQIEYVNGRPIEPEILTEAMIKELCQYTNPDHEPYVVEILSPHEVCLTYRQGITLGQIVGELMAIESWMDFPILMTVVIIKRLKVDTIVRARWKHRQMQKEKELEQLEALK